MCEMIERVSDTDYISVSHFIAWLEEEDGYELGRWRIGKDPNLASLVRIPDMMTIVNEYFGVDPKRLEAERRALLKEARQANSQKDKR